ncbi:hypothetical protein ACGF3G_00385 [Streptomyces sp. NPDC048179]|uniref:hypothetical protein n=1 Tax=Streptomyces sp. NPDC048179 TaxID=3365506 RepID=UPI003719F43B
MQGIDRDSRQYVQAMVDVTVAGQPYNPTADVVEFAFTAIGARPTTWFTGGWDGIDPIPGSNSYRAQVLAGPGSNGPVLAAGRYAVWLRITDNPEQPVMNVGQLAVT